MAAWLFEAPSATLAAWDSASLEAAMAAVEAEPGWTVAALSYELGYLFEPAAAPPGWRPDPAAPLARFWRFGMCREMTRSEGDAWLAARLDNLPPDARRAGVGGVTLGADAAAHGAGVARIRDYIAAGDCYQVNFTFPLHFTWYGDPLALYAALRERQPVRYGGLVQEGESAVLSLSPELFVARQGETLTVRPMKGTAPRAAAAECLRGSAKDRAENLMIVDLLRNDLGRLALPGSVRVDALFEIEAYPSVWQMVSQVSARVSDARLGWVLPALFPCGSITGAPKIRAMQIAGELEGKPRGLYTGALGWVGPQGDFRFNVAIRTLVLEAGHRGSMGVGSGIVADSEGAAEWRECLLKAGFLTDLDPGLRLIETLRREDGRYPLLERHLARLAASAAWLGFPCDLAEVRRRLAALPGTGLQRVRLTLGKDGIIDVAGYPLGPEPPGPRLARLAAAPITSGDPLRRHKTTARACYDAALAEIAARPEIFDVVFLNERGEVAEGARSTVFVEREGVLLTPPLSSGALPGVLRAELLATGRAREEALRPGDLAEGFMLGNALRGLLPVRWEGVA